LALGISIIADIFDFLAAPIFGLPIIGDVFDVIVTGLLYLITRSKVSVIMNLAEFIPFLGDFLPVYTVSTILWITRDQEFDELLTIRKIFNLFK
jgi:type IV secretory pathway VirB3-like protein